MAITKDVVEKLTSNLKPDEAKKLLDSLRWDVDRQITNDFGDRVWLGPLLVGGKHIGITDCCYADNPCDHHKKISEQNSQCPPTTPPAAQQR